MKRFLTVLCCTVPFYAADDTALSLWEVPVGMLSALPDGFVCPVEQDEIYDPFEVSVGELLPTPPLGIRRNVSEETDVRAGESGAQSVPTGRQSVETMPVEEMTLRTRIVR